MVTPGLPFAICSIMREKRLIWRRAGVVPSARIFRRGKNRTLGGRYLAA